MPQEFSGGFDEESNPLPRIFPQINMKDPSFERDTKYRDAVFTLDNLRKVGCKTKVHYQPRVQSRSTNPFDGPRCLT